MKNYTKYSKLSDNELLLLLRKKQETAEIAFFELYNRYHIKVYNYFYSKLKSTADANDKHQETFEKLIAAVKSGKEIGNLSSFIFTIAKHLLINHIASKYECKTNSCDNQPGKKKTVSIEEICDYENSFKFIESASFETTELIGLIKWAISALDEKYKGPITDKVYNELSIKEIAEKYNLSVNGAKKRVDRAQNMIKKILKPYINDINEFNN